MPRYQDLVIFVLMMMIDDNQKQRTKLIAFKLPLAVRMHGVNIINVVGRSRHALLALDGASVLIVRPGYNNGARSS